MPQMNIRFMSRDDRQLAEHCIACAGWEIVSAFGPTLILEVENEQDALQVQDLLNHEQIDWRDCDY